ncbi:MAG: pyridoxamine 5'-phosphate oxidase family protein [Trebonia sp.]
MTEKTQATLIATDATPETEPLAWDVVRERFSAERWYWVATAGPGERPQIRPVLAIWLDGKVYSTTSPGAAKGRNLGVRPECSLAARAPAIDIVVEGPASWVSDRHALERVAAAYDDKYGWPLTITGDGLFDAPYGAPSAGPAPYRAYEITPRLVYAFGTSDDLGVRSTRFRFR